MWGGLGGGQRQVRTLRVQIDDQIGAILGIRQAGEGHFGAGRELARAGQPFVDLFEVPASAHAREDRGEGEAMLAVADYLDHRAKAVSTEAFGYHRIIRWSCDPLPQHRPALRW